MGTCAFLTSGRNPYPGKDGAEAEDEIGRDRLTDQLGGEAIPPRSD
jgi:hypothetical protein